MNVRALSSISRFVALAAFAAPFGLAVVASGGFAVAQGTAVEDSTGVSFETTRVSGDDDTTLALTGVGVRKKFGLVKVYAFGLYVDRAAAREALSAWKGPSADALRDDPALYRALVELPAEKVAVMRFVRDVKASSMRDALSDAMDLAVAENDPARNAFVSLFVEEIQDGEEVALRMGSGGEVEVLRDGRSIGTVSSADVARGLMLSWVGDDPVSSDIKDGVVERIPTLLRAE
jgi:hypothetical protein